MLASLATQTMLLVTAFCAFGGWKRFSSWNPEVDCPLADCALTVTAAVASCPPTGGRDTDICVGR